MIFVIIVFLGLAMAAVGLMIDGLWWLMLVGFGLAAIAALAAVFVPGGLGRVRDATAEIPTTFLSEEGRGGSSASASYEGWTKEELLRPTRHANVDVTAERTEGPTD